MLEWWLQWIWLVCPGCRVVDIIHMVVDTSQTSRNESTPTFVPPNTQPWMTNNIELSLFYVL